MDKPTDKQLSCIKWICIILDLEFTGKTKFDAWKFINENKEKAEEVFYMDTYDDWKYEIYHEHF